MEPVPVGEVVEEPLVPIDQVAQRFGIRASAIRYYEERGLLEPSSRQAGRRWYGPGEIRRLAIILYWQSSGLMSLEEIGQLVGGPGAGRDWSQIVDDRLSLLNDQIERMTAARDFLVHVRSHHDAAPDGCPHYEELIWAGIRSEGIRSEEDSSSCP